MADESYPDGLLYHPEHDWAKVDGDTATFGVTWYAQDQLGEVVFFDPPDVGAQISANSAYAEVESVKAVSDVFAPMSGEVTEVNSASVAADKVKGEIPSPFNPPTGCAFHPRCPIAPRSPART